MPIIEYRIILPITVEEYEIGQLWSIAEASKRETGGGEGVEIVQDEPYAEKSGESGHYTQKMYRFQSQLPTVITKLIPFDRLAIKEESWSTYPYCKTKLSNPFYMKDNFGITVLTKHKADGGETENIHGLTKEEWDNTKVVTIDIANDPISSSDYKAEFDPKLFMSEKCGRGKLSSNWIEELKAKKQNGENPALMCAYKLVKFNITWYGMEPKFENIIESKMHRQFFDFNRQVFCWLDKWYGLKIDEIRKIEEKTKEDLKILRASGSI